ncbi:RDD family protein [Luteolibacter sp. Populi]|uniref:RDD family protein n=1 Tax=Luteolibacter sp. Populi TaxID=3230487 RepID=UPI003467C3F0
MTPENPYSSPSVTDAPPVNDTQVAIIPAGQGRRFLNCLIDSVALLVLLMIAGVGVAMVAGKILEKEASGGGTLDLLLNVAVFGPVIGYYTILEATTGLTLGKWITGTKVVTATGERPSFLTALLRTLCRHIPFEALSFLGPTARGWHDSITKTWVVRR